jgi:hypothetical protein
MQFAYPADPSNGAQNGLSPTIVQRRISVTGFDEVRPAVRSNGEYRRAPGGVFVAVVLAEHVDLHLAEIARESDVRRRRQIDIAEGIGIRAF